MLPYNIKLSYVTIQDKIKFVSQQDKIKFVNITR